LAPWVQSPLLAGGVRDTATALTVSQSDCTAQHTAAQARTWSAAWQAECSGELLRHSNVLQWHTTDTAATGADATAGTAATSIATTAAGATTAANSDTHTNAVPAEELSSHSYSDEQTFLQRIAAGGTVYDSMIAWLEAVQPDPAFLRRALEKTGSYSFPAAEAPFLAAVLSHGGLASCAMLHASSSSDSSDSSSATANGAVHNAVAGREADVLRAWAAMRQLRVHLRTQKQQFKVAQADRAAAAAAAAAVTVISDSPSSSAEPNESSTATESSTGVTDAVDAAVTSDSSSVGASSDAVDAASDASSDEASDVASDVSTTVGDTADATAAAAANTGNNSSDTMTATRPEAAAAAMLAAAVTATTTATAALAATFEEYLVVLAERSLFLLSVEPSCSSAAGQHRPAMIEPHTAELMSRYVS
jgi:hypothetical protein